MRLSIIVLLALAMSLSGCSRCGKARASADVDLGNVRVGYSDGGRVSGHPHGGPPGLRNHPHGGPPGQTRRAAGGPGIDVDVEIEN